MRNVESIEKVAKEVDGVLHLAMIPDFNKFEEVVEIDKNLINAFHRALKGTHKPLVSMSLPSLRLLLRLFA